MNCSLCGSGDCGRGLLFWGHRPQSKTTVGPFLLSQWYPTPFQDERGRKFSCAEQYMMWRKAILFDDAETGKLILRSTNPAEVKQLGRAVRGYDEEAWCSSRWEVVVQGSTLKFSQFADTDPLPPKYIPRHPCRSFTDGSRMGNRPICRSGRGARSAGLARLESPGLCAHGGPLPSARFARHQHQPPPGPGHCRVPGPQLSAEQPARPVRHTELLVVVVRLGDFSDRKDGEPPGWLSMASFVRR